MKRAKLFGYGIILCFLVYAGILLLPFVAPIVADKTKGAYELSHAFIQGIQVQSTPLIIGGVTAFLLLYALVELDLRWRKQPTHNFGSAHRATRKEVQQFTHGTSLFQKRPMPYFQLGTYHNRTISLSEKQIESNLLVTAPIGAGKSSGIIIPNLLREDGRRSVFVADVKKELVRLTAGALSEQYEVIIFDPSNPNESHGYNPLAHIGNYEQAKAFASCWVKNTGQAKDEFWLNIATLLIANTIMHLKAGEPYAPLKRVHELLCQRSFEELKAVFLESPARQVRDNVRATFENLALNSKLVGSVFLDITTRLQLLEIESVQQVTTYNDIDFRAMAEREKKPIALYLVIPRRSAELFQPLSACFILQMFTAWEEFAEGSPNGRLPRGITCYLDEFANLGHIPNMSGIISTARHTGVGLAIIIQSFNQLDERYSHEIRKTIVTNSVTHLLMSGAGKEEVEFYSDRIGNTTVKTINRNTKSSFLFEKEEGKSNSETGRPLYTPDELRTLPKGKMLMIDASSAPLILETQPYFKDKNLNKRATMPFDYTNMQHKDNEARPIALLPAPRTQSPERNENISTNEETFFFPEE